MHALYDWVIGWVVSPQAVPALLGIAFAESSFFPIPPDVLLIPMAFSQPERALWFAAVATVGSVTGGCFGYLIGRVGGQPLLRRWIGDAKMASVHNTFQRYEAWAILIAGFTPVPYKVFTIAAGVFYVNPAVFVVASCISRGARFLLVAGIIQLFGPSIRPLLERYFDWAALALVALVLAGYGVMAVVQRRRVGGRERTPRGGKEDT